MLPPITLKDLDAFIGLRDTSHALPVEPWAGELPPAAGWTPPPDDLPFLPSDDDGPWETTL